VVGDGTWLTVGEVAALLGVHPNTVIRYADEGWLDSPHRMKRLPGRHRRIHKDSVDRLAREIAGDDQPD
jgi:excisionase family DNA binding protein